MNKWKRRPRRKVLKSRAMDYMSLTELVIELKRVINKGEGH